MGYTGLVQWHTGVPRAAARSTARRVYRVPMLPGRPGDGSATPSYGGLVGWYAAVATATERQEPTPGARQSMPHAA